MLAEELRSKMQLSEQISLGREFQALDWGVFLGTLSLTFLSVLYGYLRKPHKVSFQTEKESWKDYILMGRQLTLPLFIATLVSTWYGGILGVTQIAFQYGIYNFIIQGVFWYVAYIFFALFLVKRVRKMNVVTFPELMSKFLGPGPAKFSAALVFFKTIPVTYGISIGVFLKLILGISFGSAVLMGLGFVLFYSLFGGFRSIVFSDLIQFTLMYIGVAAVALFSLAQFGGLGYLQEKLPASHFSLCGDFSISDTFVWFFIAASTTCLNPTFYQRCLAATSHKVAKRGIFISIFFWFCFDLCTTSIGLYAKAALPNATPLDASMIYCLQILPQGFKGLFLGAVLATILSTLDSFLFISSNVLSYDLKIVRLKSIRQSHILSTIITGMITYLIVMVYEGNVELIWRTLKGMFASCLFAPLVLSYLRPGSISTHSFFISCLGVIVSTLYWQAYKPLSIDAFYIGIAVSTGYLLSVVCVKTRAFQRSN